MAGGFPVGFRHVALLVAVLRIVSSKLFIASPWLFLCVVPAAGVHLFLLAKRVPINESSQGCRVLSALLAPVRTLSICQIPCILNQGRSRTATTWLLCKVSL